MQTRLSAVTLAVADLARSRRFYEGLGWAAAFAGDDVAFYQANGLVLALWDAKAFAAETGLPARSGGICLAHNLPDRAAVDGLLAQAAAAGASVTPAAQREWGGHSGHFRDPDGHTWEV
ncbi:MAG TPA: VOC family protein, partial [Candidatus Thermoplasmatota archaeon]|nr:VOC family protein [Candidatus Thermoplasmatota archaeon]